MRGVKPASGLVNVIVTLLKPSVPTVTLPEMAIGGAVSENELSFKVASALPVSAGRVTAGLPRDVRRPARGNKPDGVVNSISDRLMSNKVRLIIRLAQLGGGR